MKIYQIHETGGQYEDYFDYIVGTYLHKDKAEIAMQILIDKEELRRQEYEKCQFCPIGDLDLNADTVEVMRGACQKYCNHSQIYEALYGFECENEASYRDEVDYYLKEIEVIE